MKATDVQAFFERIATDWDTMRLAYYDERVIEKISNAARLESSMTVADVGTGTGFVAAGIAGHVQTVKGIDNSSAMLEQARRNLSALGITNVELIEGDTAALPLADQAVDAAAANMVLHHAVDPAAMLAEMARIVKPGGTVVIVDEVNHEYSWMREEHADVWLGFSRDQIEGLVQNAGFLNVGYEPLGMQ